MRAWFSLIAIVAAVGYAEPARADTPPDVYSDFATDGTLNCGHSRSALTGILNDASLYQYGDPLTFMQLKLAIRRQLAGGCRRQRAAAEPVGTASGGTATTEPAVGTEPPTKADENRPGQAAQPALEAQNKGKSRRSDEAERGGEMTLLGAGLLLLALGSGGWAAKRAFAN